ncbi:MAG: dehydratase [Dehalococcoidia bacterium]|nr:dehydratase [Dehalococcoidia bacterium]
MSASNWADVETGQEIPSLVKNITMRQLVMWAGVSGDFNPLHYDCDFAASRGLPNVVAHGQLVAAFLCQMLSNWQGAACRLKKLDISYREFNYLGDTITCCGRVREVSSDRRSVTVEIWAENQRGEKTVCGNALLQFDGP